MNNTNKPQTENAVTRRSFLTSTSKVVAGGALLGALPVERFALGAANDDTIKIALIGCGGRGSGAANQALSTGNVKLVAMADAFQDRLESSLANLKTAQKDKVDVAPENRFVGFDAYKKAIDMADVVVLAAPPGFRPSHFEYAVEKGKHVFMEKPVAVDGPGVRKILAAAEESKKKNLKVVVGLQRRFDKGYQETVQRLHDGAIGDILAMRMYWNDAGVWVKPRQPGQTEMDYQMRNWYYFVWLSGDHIVEQHIHNLDVGNWIKQAYPVKVYGMGGRQVRTGKDYGQIFDHHACQFEYADGTRMYSECRHIPNCWTSVSEHAIGTKGTADVSSKLIKGPNQWRFRGQMVDPYQVEHNELFAAIRNGTELNQGENAGKSAMTGVMGRMATYSGQVVTWDDALNSELNTFPEKLAWDAMPRDLPDKDGFYAIPMPGKTVAF